MRLPWPSAAFNPCPSPRMWKTRRQKYQLFGCCKQPCLPKKGLSCLCLSDHKAKTRIPNNKITRKVQYRVFEQSNILFILPPSALGNSDIKRQIVWLGRKTNFFLLTVCILSYQRRQSHIAAVVWLHGHRIR